MCTTHLKQVLSKIVIVTSFAMSVFAANSTVSANTQDMLEFLDKNSTARSEFETKTIHLGMNDSEEQLFSKERYRKNPRKQTSKAAAHVKNVAQKDAAVVVNDKPALGVSKEDYALNFGGSMKMEHVFQRNMALFNKSVPDEAEYFKNTFDFITNFSYGENRFGHKAVEATLDFMHKGYWGKNGLVADSEPSSPTQLKLSDTFFGEHSHQNGRPFVWLREAWMRVSLNAIANAQSKNIHTVKIGWFPFELGRGIALGSCFGLNSDLFGLYSYPEEKSAAGININGELLKDVLSYDLYFSRFEERNKGLRDTSAVIRKHYTSSTLPWRGLGKDNDLMAARFKVSPLAKGGAHSLQLEPYIMYNSAPDQKVDVAVDSNTYLGSYGLSVEHAYKNFEIGGEVAFNFGKTEMLGVDLNSTEVFRDVDGKLAERYSKIVRYDLAAFPVDGRTREKVIRSRDVDAVVGQLNSNAPDLSVVVAGPYSIISTKDRYRKAYENAFGGWMGVIDASYNVKDIQTKFAVGAGYASGDQDPDRKQESKTFKGFVGLNECYSGKRVKSIIVLDERILQRPVVTGADGNIEVSKDMSFTDLAFGGVSAVWTPKLFNKSWSINSNALAFWKAYAEKKPLLDPVTGSATLTDQPASTFMGTELNLLSRVELLKDFSLFANLGVFLPGQFFKDFSGVALGKDEFFKAVDSVVSAADAKDYRLKSDPAYHVNVGLTYKF